MSPGLSSVLEIGEANRCSVSVVWRDSPHTRLTYAEQSMPASELPPHRYGTPRSACARPSTMSADTRGGPETHCAGAGSAFGRTGTDAAPAVSGGANPRLTQSARTSALTPSKGSGAGRSGGESASSSPSSPIAWVAASLAMSTSSPSAGVSERLRGDVASSGAAMASARTSEEAVSSPVIKTPKMSHRRMLPHPCEGPQPSA